jgi:hypothetical protein
MLGVSLGTAVNTAQKPPVRLPTSLDPVDGRYFAFVERNPPLTLLAAKLLRQPQRDNTNRDSQHRVIEFARALPLDCTTALNAALHALMTFGPQHPVHLQPDRTIGVIDFIQNYFHHIDPQTRQYAPAWIDRIEQEYFVIPSATPRIVIDHLGQLAYACALAQLPLETHFTLKTGRSVSLKELFDTEIKYADPNEHDPVWQIPALAYYRPDETWKNVNRKTFSALDFLEITAPRVTGHVCCGHTHLPISAAYAISILSEYANSPAERQKLAAARNHLDHCVELVRNTTYPDGAVSKTWWIGKQNYPHTKNELIMLNGHTLEWLAAYLEPQHLRADWVKNIADRFCLAVTSAVRDAVPENQNRPATLPFEYAALCHGAKALLTYHHRANPDTERSPR